MNVAMLTLCVLPGGAGMKVASNASVLSKIGAFGLASKGLKSNIMSSPFVTLPGLGGDADPRHPGGGMKPKEPPSIKDPRNPDGDDDEPHMYGIKGVSGISGIKGCSMNM